MISNIEQFYFSKNSLPDHKKNYWQHKCGLFQWHLSENNVNLCCEDMGFREITWPHINKENPSGGQK